FDDTMASPLPSPTLPPASEELPLPSPPPRNLFSKSLEDWFKHPRTMGMEMRIYFNFFSFDFLVFMLIFFTGVLAVFGLRNQKRTLIAFILAIWLFFAIFFSIFWLGEMTIRKNGISDFLALLFVL
ncbi:hypothetical protein PMAYCL1PPCAC_17342, partial [Pristionchus mayeri]